MYPQGSGGVFKLIFVCLQGTGEEHKSEINQYIQGANINVLKIGEGGGIKKGWHKELGGYEKSVPRMSIYFPEFRLYL